MERFEEVNGRENEQSRQHCLKIAKTRDSTITLLLTFICLCYDHAVKKLVLMFCFNF